jgi:two-component system OmpR family response regulator
MKGRPMSTQTILIADDEPTLRHLVRVIVASPERHVLEAADGDAAWSLLQTGRPQVALLDVIMPHRDGIEVTRAIRADPALAATRVILLTGMGEPGAIARGRAAGADHIVTKPFSPARLLATIEACLKETEHGAATV